jgi:ribose 5-phosphate isomerase B
MAAALRSTAVKTFVVGADHGGFELKEQLLAYVRAQYGDAVTIVDTGYGAERCDYPDVASAVGAQVAAAGDAATTCGMLVCGTGIGISIAANKVDGVRAALCHDHYTASMSRQHNNANVLALGGALRALARSYAALPPPRAPLHAPFAQSRARDVAPPFARARALAHPPLTSRLARTHVPIGRVTGTEVAKGIVDTFLGTEFEGGRHATRVGKIMAIEGDAKSAL